MRIRILALVIVSAVALSGQKHKFSWQEACFKNPAAPFCQGAEFFKHTGPSKDAKTSPTPGVVTNPTSSPEKATPSVIAVDGIDWRFADPAADAIIGFNFSGLASSQVARSLITQLGDKLNDSDIQKILSGLSAMDQVAISVHGGQVLVLATGGVADAHLPNPEPGLKAEAVSGNAMLIGPVDAVDQALKRMATKGPASELAPAAAELQANSEYWAVASSAFLGPQAASAGVQRFALAISVRNQLGSRLIVEFNGTPSQDALRLWPAAGTPTSAGNTVHYDFSVTAENSQQAFAQLAGSPLGRPLAPLMKVGLNLPVRDAAAMTRTKPVIYGLDDGPKVVKQ